MKEQSHEKKIKVPDFKDVISDKVEDLDSDPLAQTSNTTAP
jgi:hypothetical protein